MRIVATILGAIVLSALAVCTASAAKDDTLLVSRAAGARGAGANGPSDESSISADGKLVAFDSSATNLLAADAKELSDIFVRDVASDTLRLVSRASGAGGAAANQDSFSPVISADGRYVAFASSAGNLDPADTDADPETATSDIYVRDLKTNTTKLVSRASGAAGAKGDSESIGATISGDGRYVAFVSSSRNLHPQDRDDTDDVFVRDLKTNTTSLVTRPVLAVPKNGASSGSPAISADGRSVAFVTSRTDLYPHGTTTESANDVLVRDLQTGKVELVSRAPGPAGAPADDESGHPSISADGRLVSFHSSGTNLAAGDDKSVSDVFVRDLKASTTTLVSVVPGVPQSEQAGGESFADSISADGRYVTFTSGAAGLHPGGAVVNEFDEPVPDVFVRDLKARRTTLVSRASGAAGASGNDLSGSSVISRDGRFVAFSSAATNLHPDAVVPPASDDVEEEADSPSNVYVRDVLGPQDDSDGRSGKALCPFRGHVFAGTNRADVHNGSAARDVMFGFGGNDVLRGRGGRDCLFGQPGRDRLLGQNGADRLFGGPGSDRLDGGRGSDRMRGQGGGDRLRGGSGSDRLNGGDRGDRLLGGSGRDRLEGARGNDRLRAGPGADRLVGGRGDDRLHGQSGDDRLHDHSGRDRLWGGAGEDRIDATDRTRRGRSRSDEISCGAGGQDVAVVDFADLVAADCERIVRR